MAGETLAAISDLASCKFLVSNKVTVLTLVLIGPIHKTSLPIISHLVK